MTIINLIGQTVRTLSEETLAAGNHLKQWDGRNDAGERVAAGPYLLRLENGKQVQLNTDPAGEIRFRIKPGNLA